MHRSNQLTEKIEVWDKAGHALASLMIASSSLLQQSPKRSVL
ncbi:hypothetical protein SAMN05216308_11649 [Nitrosospira sp. Nsp13]|nr:hypothetical protein SAMN05216308_11649 [Nitrosospira sp. Nsp13]